MVIVVSNTNLDLGFGCDANVVVKTSCWIYVRYIAGILKTRSNFAAKSKVHGRLSEGNADLLGKGKRRPCHMKHCFF